MTVPGSAWPRMVLQNRTQGPASGVGKGPGGGWEARTRPWGCFSVSQGAGVWDRTG